MQNINKNGVFIVQSYPLKRDARFIESNLANILALANVFAVHRLDEQIEKPVLVHIVRVEINPIIFMVRKPRV